MSPLIFASALLLFFISRLQFQRQKALRSRRLALPSSKALICAKFVSLGHMLHAGEGFKSVPLIWPTLYKSVVFLVLLLGLNALEEIIAGRMHHRTVADSLAEFGEGPIDQLVATSIIGLLILIPVFAFRTLGEVVGEGNPVSVFFQRRHSTNNASQV